MAAKSSAMRLATLYATVERIRSVELRMAESEVDDAVCAAAIADAVRESQQRSMRDALASGRRDEWRIAQTANAANETQIARLAVLRVKQEALRDEAVVRHRASRLQVEQMDSLVVRSRERESREETLQAQAESDDRFASQRAWDRMKSR